MSVIIVVTCCVCVSPEESTDARHVTPTRSRRNYLPLSHMDGLNRWKITKHGAARDCECRLSWGPRVVVVVVVVLLSFVSLEETSEVSDFILKKKNRKKKEKRTCDCDKHEKSMVQARFVMVEHGELTTGFFLGAYQLGPVVDGTFGIPV